MLSSSSFSWIMSFQSFFPKGRANRRAGPVLQSDFIPQTSESKTGFVHRYPLIFRLITSKECALSVQLSVERLVVDRRLHEMVCRTR